MKPTRTCVTCPVLLTLVLVAASCAGGGEPDADPPLQIDLPAAEPSGNETPRSQSGSSTPGSIVCNDEDRIPLPARWPHTLPAAFELSIADETGPTFTTRGATPNPDAVADGFRDVVFPGGSVDKVVEDENNRIYKIGHSSGSGNLEMFKGSTACWQLRFVFKPAPGAVTADAGSETPPAAPGAGEAVGRVRVVFGEGQVDLPALTCVGFASGPVEVEASNGKEWIRFAGPRLRPLSGFFQKANGKRVTVENSSTAGFNPNNGKLLWSADGVGASGGSEQLIIEATCDPS